MACETEQTTPVTAKVGEESFEAALCAEAAAQNAQNERLAVGNGGGMPQEYLTPAQVRAMDRREVREHYALIIESMKHWQ